MDSCIERGLAALASSLFFLCLFTLLLGTQRMAVGQGKGVSDSLLDPALKSLKPCQATCRGMHALNTPQTIFQTPRKP